MSTGASGSEGPADDEIFTVSAAMDCGSWLFCEHPRLARALGNLETELLQETVEATTVEQPLWVAGLARSGSTLLLEILAGLPGVVSHTYKDFPPVFTPYAWNSLLQRVNSRAETVTERAHRDGIVVTPDSPEAMEEPVWVSFFPDAHDASVSNVIRADADPACADYLRNHIRKLLAVRNGHRYLAKANYQVTRLEYLLQHFPDARFVVPVREPAAHIASLMKQHALFSRGQAANERARRHLRRVGHFEFGLDRTPINCGHGKTTAEILSCWQSGDEVRGWALYWADVYGHVADRLEADPALARASLVVDYTTLCNDPEATLARLYSHCDLQVDASYAAASAGRITAPDYYTTDYSAAEQRTIEEATAGVNERLQRLAAAGP